MTREPRIVALAGLPAGTVMVLPNLPRRPPETDAEYRARVARQAVLIRNVGLPEPRKNPSLRARTREQA